MAERDPRVNPNPGDVLRGKFARTFEVTARHDNGCSVNQSKPWGPRKICDCGLEETEGKIRTALSALAAAKETNGR